MKHERAILLLSDYLLRELDEVARTALESHLDTCPECRAELETMREFAAGASPAAGAHPEAAELVAFLDPAGDLPTERMAAIALHVGDCGACARELNTARALLGRPRALPARATWLVAAALAVLLALFAGWRLGVPWSGSPGGGFTVASLQLPERFDPDEADPVEGDLDPSADTKVELNIPLAPIQTAGAREKSLNLRVASLPDRRTVWTGRVKPAQAATPDGRGFLAALPAGLLGEGTYELEVLDEGNPVYYVKFRLRSVHGGKQNESNGAVIQTPDGGFLLASCTYSLGSAPGERSDGWLLRLNRVGEEVWSRTYGGDGWDALNCIRATPDGGYAMTGYAGSAFADLWLLKVDTAGEVLIDRRWGSEHGWENGRDLICTADGGYALIGYTRSYGKGPRSVYLVKTDADGRREWDQVYGGEGEDTGVSLLQTADGGFLLGCNSNSFGAGGGDLWLIKTDGLGQIEWERTYGDSLPQNGGKLLPAADGGYFMVGSSLRDERLDFYDGWLLKLATDGSLEWERRYGGEYNEVFGFGLATAGGGLVLAGDACPERGNADLWLLGLDGEGEMLWEQRFGGKGDEISRWLAPTADGGFMLCATTDSWGSGGTDLWLIKTDPRGRYQPGVGSEEERRSWSRVLAHAAPGGMR